MLLYNSGPAPSMVPPEGSVAPIAGAHVMGGAIGVPEPAGPAHQREFIDYTTSMITDEDPLRGLLFC